MSQVIILREDGSYEVVPQPGNNTQDETILVGFEFPADANALTAANFLFLMNDNGIAKLTELSGDTPHVKHPILGQKIGIKGNNAIISSGWLGKAMISEALTLQTDEPVSTTERTLIHAGAGLLKKATENEINNPLITSSGVYLAAQSGDADSLIFIHPYHTQQPASANTETDNLEIFADTTSIPGVELCGIRSKNNAVAVQLFRTIVDNVEQIGINFKGLTDESYDFENALDSQQFALLTTDGYGNPKKISLSFLGQLFENLSDIFVLQGYYEKKVLLGSVTYEQINAASANSSITISLQNITEPNYYIERIVAVTTTTFDVLFNPDDTKLTFNSIDLTNKVNLMQGKKMYTVDYSFQDYRDNIETSLQISFENGGGEVNPQNLTSGEIKIFAICKPFPYQS